jgi:hypothetical protein
LHGSHRGRATRYEHAFALARVEQAARDELVVGDLNGVLGEAELLLEDAHGREARPSGQAAGGDVLDQGS